MEAAQSIDMQHMTLTCSRPLPAGHWPGRDLRGKTVSPSSQFWACARTRSPVCVSGGGGGGFGGWEMGGDPG